MNKWTRESFKGRRYNCLVLSGFPGGSDGKESTCNARDLVQSLGQKDPLEEMATHSSILAWRSPWTEEPGGLQSMRSQRVNRTEWLTPSFPLGIEWLTFSFPLGDAVQLWILELKAHCLSCSIGDVEIQSFPLMCNWRHGYFKRHTCVVLREAGESEDAIPRCFHPGCRAAGLPGCRHQHCERWQQLWGRTAFPTDVSFES